MNKLYKLVLFSFLIIGSLGLTVPQKNNGSYFHLITELGVKSDSSINLSPIHIDSFDLDIFSPSSGVQFYRDGIVFLSPTKIEQKMVPYHLSFGDVEAYYAILEDTLSAQHSVFSRFSSFSYPCDALTFSHDYVTMYYTKYSKKDGGEKIYKAHYSDSTKKSGWVSDLQPLDFCMDSSSYTHPALSANEEFMIFASDRNGSLGGMDLFMTQKEGNSWSVPITLGNGINTKANEIFPFLDSENNLFFSSDGLPGYGGYDVFISKFNGHNWDKPINLSNHVNSNNDDIAFTVNRKDGKSALFTIKQKSTSGEMQLYRVTLNAKNKNNSLLSLPLVLYNMALLENEFPSSDLSASVDTIQIKPTEPLTKVELIKKDTISKPQEEITLSENKIEAPVATTPVEQMPLPEKEITTKPPSKGVLADTKIQTLKTDILESIKVRDNIVYKVQFLSAIKPKRNLRISVEGKNYTPFEYFYKGEYRYTVGEFSTIIPAIELQYACRRAGYPKAFVVVFKNNVRSLDPELFRK